MEENKRKHLEFIHNVITRMNSNSFLIKGWCTTLVSALFALAAGGTNIKFALISFIVVPIFWLLDGFFVATERRYRALFEDVAKKTHLDEIDFSMNIKPYKSQEGKSWIDGVFSITILLFYGISIVTIILVMYFFHTT